MLHCALRRLIWRTRCLLAIPDFQSFFLGCSLQITIRSNQNGFGIPTISPEFTMFYTNNQKSIGQVEIVNASQLLGFVENIDVGELYIIQCDSTATDTSEQEIA